jgi:hypothetical protein
VPRVPLIVCQHLENVSRAALEKYQDVVRDYIRGRHGIYVLYRRGKVYYVGLAHNLRTRLKRHLHDRHSRSWDRFSVYLTIGDVPIRELESLVLRISKPPGNATSGKFRRSEDLSQRLAADVRRLHRRELEALLGRERRAAKKKEAERPAESQGRAPVLARYVHKRMKLRGRHKGKTLRAYLRRDGLIRFEGELFSTPSKAAAAACRRRKYDGWSFWHYERAPGDWVPLKVLRR